MKTTAAKRSDLTRAIEGAAAHLRPLLIACRDHGCAFCVIGQDAGAFDIPPGKPTMCVLGDDMHTAKGPSAFHLPSLRRYLRTCAGGTIVTSGPEPDVYSAATYAPIALRKSVIIVETRLEVEQAWLDFFAEALPQLPLFLSTVKPMGYA